MSQNPKSYILVTFDSMKNANTGLFYFGYGLGHALIKQNRDRFNLSFYVKLKNKAIFKGLVKLTYLFKLHKIIFPQKQKYNLVHFTDQFCRLKPQMVTGKKVLTIHDLNQIPELKNQPQLLQAYFDKLGSFINQCDSIVAISNFVAQDVLQHFPQAKGKISVIYNGADKLAVSLNHIPAYVPKSKFLFTIGNLSVKKNFHVLPALLQDNDFELVISGIDSSYRDKVLDEALKYNCTDRVIITGPISNEDKAWYYKNCEAFVFPSLTEGFGLPVIEAMHFGKPVFLSNLTSLPEVGGDKANYFNNFEPAHMQQVLANGLKNYHDNNLAEEIKKHADQFSWDNTAQQYLTLYTECISK